MIRSLQYNSLRLNLKNARPDLYLRDLRLSVVILARTSAHRLQILMFFLPNRIDFFSPFSLCVLDFPFWCLFRISDFVLRAYYSTISHPSAKSGSAFLNLIVFVSSPFLIVTKSLRPCSAAFLIGAEALPSSFPAATRFARIFSSSARMRASSALACAATPQ